MPEGGGKYDSELKAALTSTQAQAGLLVIIGGNRGQGFSIAAPKSLMLKIPNLLRYMAAQIEADLAGGGSDDLPH